MLASAATSRALPRLAGSLSAMAPAALHLGSRVRTSSRNYYHTSVSAFDTAVEGNSTDPSATGAPFNNPTVFVSFDVYKTKGALNIKPIAPTWQQTPKGGFEVHKDGAFLFELAPSSGERSYAWDKKVSLGMNCQEIANILAEPGREHSFYHDPNKGRAGEGQIQKTLKWSPAPDGKVYFINATVKDNTNNTTLSASCNLSQGEFYLFKRLADYAFPYLMGWDQKIVPTLVGGQM